MSKKVNIGGDANDANYRYKRDVVQLAKIAKHGGLTQIMNMNFICKQLKVNQESFTKVYYKKISQKGITLFGTNQFKGELTVELAEKLLNDLIQDKLLCPKCRLPEWSGSLCSACGHTKTSKQTQVQEEEEPTCPHVSMVISMVKTLYGRALAEPVHREDMYTAIDYFWKLPLCLPEGIVKPEKCEHRYASWLKNVNMMLASYEENK